jgi:hypothetical protein
LLEDIGRDLWLILTFSSAFRMIFTMKAMFEVGLNEQLSVPPEKRFRWAREQNHD